MRKSLAGTLGRLVRDSRGGVLTYTAIAIPALVGASGMAVDVAAWHLNKRAMQTAADSAAVAGALELMRTGTGAVNGAAEREALENGYKPNQTDVLTVNNPPLSGMRAGAGDAVEVILTRSVPTFFTHYFVGGPVNIAARAVATSDINDTCVWALDPSASGAFAVSGSSQVTFECGVFVNSNSVEGLTQSGNSCLTATKIKVGGGYLAGACLNPTPITNAPPVVDPLGWMQPPDYGSCTTNNKVKVNAGQTLTLSPGVYCGGIEVSGNGTLHFNPGLYVVRGLTFASNSTVTGTDVNFYLPQNAGQGQSINIQAGANVDLSADPFGDIPGVLFYHDRNSPSNVNHSIAGGASMTLEGILYFPNQHLDFAGGSSLDASASMLIAKTVKFSGNTNIGGFKGSVVSANPALVTVALIE